MVPGTGFSAEHALALILAKAEKSEERENQLERFIGAANAELQIAKEEREKGHLVVNKLTSDVSAMTENISSIGGQVAQLKARVESGVSVQHSKYDNLFIDARSTTVRFFVFVFHIITSYSIAPRSPPAVGILLSAHCFKVSGHPLDVHQERCQTGCFASPIVLISVRASL